VLDDFNVADDSGAFRTESSLSEQARSIQSNIDADGFFDLLIERFARI
jgi:hypothetical protein